MPREQAGSGDTGGPADDRGRDSGSERLNDWQRIDAEKPDRDRAMKAWNATHGPGEEFERAGRSPDPEVKRARPERLEPDDLTAEQRADLEAASGQSLEHMLQRRNEARAHDAASADANAERPAMQPRADLPDDDAYNWVISAYNRGDMPYTETIRRLQDLDASPVHGKPLDTTTNAATPAVDARAETGEPVPLDQLAEPSGAERPSDPPSYESPTDVRDALLSGKSVPEVRREFIDQLGEDPVEEEASEIVRGRDGYREERGTPKELPEEISPEEASKLAELRRVAWQRGSEINQAVDQGVKDAHGIVRSLRPTGTEQRQPPDLPPVDQSRPGVDAGDAATATMVVAVLAAEGFRAGVRAKLGRRKAEQ